MQTDMTNQETIICENCGEAYLVSDEQCPVCSAANPYTIAEFLGEDFEDLEEFEEEEFKPRPWWRSPLGCISIILFLAFIIAFRCHNFRMLLRIYCRSLIHSAIISIAPSMASSALSISLCLVYCSALK